jgi:hypothetical protein
MASDKASNSNPKVAEAEKLVKKAEKLTKLSFTRWFPDWTAATPLYEQAGMSYPLELRRCASELFSNSLFSNPGNHYCQGLYALINSRFFGELHLGM